MRLALRIFVVVVVFAASYLFIYWVPFSLIPGARTTEWLPNLGAFVGAVALSWFVWSRSRFTPAGLVSSVLYGAAVVGAVGFAVGFFGPLLLAPGGAQGPLLGIFITGPVGALVGGVGGFVYWFTRTRAARAA